MKHSLLTVMTLMACLPLKADQEELNSWSLIVQWDNDLLTGTDQGYTNGSRIAFTKKLNPNSPNYNRLQRILKSLTGANKGNALNNFRFDDRAIENIQFGMGFSQLMFTPKDPNTLNPRDGERPYAGWMGLEFSLQAGSERSANTATLTLGTTGENSYTDDVQKWIHQNVSNSPVFQGWDSQAPSELTLNLHFDHKTRLDFIEQLDLEFEIDGFYEWGTSIGNLRTDVYLGGLIRAGYNLPVSYATPRVQLGSFTNTIFGESKTPLEDDSISVFAGARAYGVLHDITLDGPLFREWDESVESKPLVGELIFGVTGRCRWGEISLTHSLRSHEFEGQVNQSRYGSVLLRVGTDF